MRGGGWLLMRWMVLALVAAMTSGCADVDADDQLTSNEALELATDHLAQYDGAKIISIRLDDGHDLDDGTWRSERGFAVLSGADAAAGTSPSWFVSALLPPEAGHLPQYLSMQVTADGVTTKGPEGGTALGDDPSGAWHHGADDACFTKQNTQQTFEDMMPLTDIADSSDVAATLAGLDALVAFLPDAGDVRFEAVAYRSSYGNTGTGYWCYETQQAWRFSATDFTFSYQALLDLDGTLVRTVDWTTEPGNMHNLDYETTLSHTALDWNTPQRHEQVFIVGPESTSMTLIVSLSGQVGRGTEEVVTLVSPSGQEFSGRDNWFDIDFPEAGQWTAITEYTPGALAGEMTYKHFGYYNGLS